MRVAFLMMYLSYGVRALVPIVVAPYLIRTLQPTHWGVFSLVFAFCVLAFQIVEFGFGLTATRDIAIHRDDKRRVSEIFWSVVICQLGLMVLIAIFGYPIFALLHLGTRWDLYLPALAYTFFQGASPLWFYRGLEKLVLVASLEIAGKIAVIAAIPLLVHGPQDDWIAVTIFAISSMFSSIAAFGIALRFTDIVRPPWQALRQNFTDAFPLFLVRISATAFTAANTMMLGLFVQPLMVGYFAGVERIVTGVRLMMNPAIDTVFPRISRILAGKTDEFHIVRWSIFGMAGFGAAMSIALFAAAEPIVTYLFGSPLQQPLEVARILALGPVLIGITHAVGTQWLLPLGHRREYTTGIVIGAIVNFSFLVVALQLWADKGYLFAAVATILGQFATACYLTATALRVSGNSWKLVTK